MSIYFLISIYFNNHFLIGTYINGVNVSFKTVEEADNKLLNESYNYVLEIRERKDIIEYIKGDKINFKYNGTDKIGELKKKQNGFLWPKFLFTKEDYNINNIYSYEKALLDEEFNKLSCFDKENIIEPLDACFHYNGTEYEIIEEVYGNKVNKDYLEENNIAFKLNYSDAYKKKNLFKEINFKMFTTIIVFIMITAAVTLMLDYYAQFKDNETVEKELVDINKIIDDASSNNNLDENDRDIDYIDNREETITTTKKVSSSYSNAYYTNYKQVFNELMKKNDDTVGYLMVNNTKINYPVVQASTNSSPYL